MSRNRLLFRSLLALVLCSAVLATMPARADAPVSDQSPSRLGRYIACALGIFVATTPRALDMALTSCLTLYLDEAR